MRTENKDNSHKTNREKGTIRISKDKKEAYEKERRGLDT